MKTYLVHHSGVTTITRKSGKPPWNKHLVVVQAETEVEAIDSAIYQYFIDTQEFLEFYDNRDSEFYRTLRELYRESNSTETFQDFVHDHLLDALGEEYIDRFVYHLIYETSKAKDFPKEMRYHLYLEHHHHFWAEFRLTATEIPFFEQTETPKPRFLG